MADGGSDGYLYLELFLIARRLPGSGIETGRDLGESAEVAIDLYGKGCARNRGVAGKVVEEKQELLFTFEDNKLEAFRVS